MEDYESNIRARRKWDSANMITMGTRVRREIADDFKKACAANNTTPHQAIKQFIEDYVSGKK